MRLLRGGAVVQMLRELLRQPARLCRRGRRRMARRGGQCAAGEECRGLLPRRCIAAPRKAGICATRTCSRRCASSSTPRARSPRRWCGRTTATSAMPRFTEMGMDRGELNIGQLAKERFGDEARLIGFGTHSGTVAAADDWDAPMEVKAVRPSLPDSYRAPVPRQRGRRASCSTCARARTSRRGGAERAAARALHRRHLPPRNRALEPLFAVRSCRDSSTAGSGSTRPAR